MTLRRPFSVYIYGYFLFFQLARSSSIEERLDFHSGNKIGMTSCAVPSSSASLQRTYNSLRSSSSTHRSAGGGFRSYSFSANHNHPVNGDVGIKSIYSNHRYPSENATKRAKLSRSSKSSSSHRLSRSLEDLPRDIKEHILKCKCSCDHMGYGNYSVSFF